MSLSRILAVAMRLVRQVIRDKRLLAFMFFAPIIVMTLVSLVIRNEERTYNLGLYVTGVMSLFIGDLITTLEDAGFTVEELLEEEDPKQLLRSRSIDGVLIIDENFLVDRAEGRAGEMTLLLEGADPMVEMGIAGDLREALSDVVNGLPQLLDPECPRICAEGVNTMPPSIETERLTGDSGATFSYSYPQTGDYHRLLSRVSPLWTGTKCCNCFFCCWFT